MPGFSHAMISSFRARKSSSDLPGGMKQDISILRSPMLSPKSNNPSRPGTVIVLFVKSGILFSFVILVAKPKLCEVLPLNLNPI